MIILSRFIRYKHRKCIMKANDFDVLSRSFYERFIWRNNNRYTQDEYVSRQKLYGSGDLRLCSWRMTLFLHYMWVATLWIGKQHFLFQPRFVFYLGTSIIGIYLFLEWEGFALTIKLAKCDLSGFANLWEHYGEFSGIQVSSQCVRSFFWIFKLLSYSTLSSFSFHSSLPFFHIM